MQVQEATLLLRRGRFSQVLLRGDIRDIENTYRANGFSQVKIESDVEDDYRGAQNQLAVEIKINEAPQTLVGSFQILGNATQSADSFPPLNTQPGQPFSDSRLVEDRDQLLNYYFNKDRKSTRLNSSHGSISYAVFCLKKKTKKKASTNLKN